MIGRSGIAGLATVLTAICAASGPAAAHPPSCATPPGLIALDASLVHTARRLNEGGVLRIVTIGSSSTAGFGATSAQRDYPDRLQRELSGRLPGLAVIVINRGIGGQDVGQELARFDRDVIAVHPDLVIWQVGTNAVLRSENFTTDAALIRRGVGEARESGSDIVLMDLQYAPRVLARPGYRDMERLLIAIARDMRVGLFRRFAVMAHWAETGQLAPAPMIAPDGLHMTDASYGCLAAELAEVIAENGQRHIRRAAALTDSSEGWPAAADRSP